MRQATFYSFILALTMGWMQIYSSARHLYNGMSDLKEHVAQLEKQSLKLSVQRDLDHEHFLEFRQSVATLMPDVLKEKGLGVEGYPYRRLASTISRKDSDELRGMIAKTLFERGKEYFRKKDYEKSNRVFQQVIDRYGYTTYVTEAYFLMAEGHFLQNELEECTRIVQQMVDLFPQSELTGFALIRLGRIYEIQKRTEEAVDIYRTVMRSYPQRDVASQAKASLKGIDL